jgi:hypothetical protein
MMQFTVAFEQFFGIHHIKNLEKLAFAGREVSPCTPLRIKASKASK